MRKWEQRLTSAQREGIRHEVRHEWRMVQQTTQALIGISFGDLRVKWCVQTALLDSLLMHARSLHDFFLLEPRRTGDVAVRQILPPQLADWRPSGLDELSASIDAINKRFSHLTYERLDGDASWVVNGLQLEIDSAFEQLIAVLPECEREFWQA